MKGYIKKRRRVDPKTGKQRTSRVWTVVYDEPVARGEQRRQKMKSGFRTREEAEKWFTRKREQLERGFTGIDDKTTIADYFTHWLRSIDVGAAAYHQYEAYARRFVVPALGSIRLCDLKPSHVENAKRTWASKRKCKGEGTIAARTVRHIWATLSIALNRAKKQRIILFNPCEVVDAPRFERKEMRALDGAAAEHCPRLLRRFGLGAAVGCRSGADFGAASHWRYARLTSTFDGGTNPVTRCTRAAFSTILTTRKSTPSRFARKSRTRRAQGVQSLCRHSRSNGCAVTGASRKTVSTRSGYGAPMTPSFSTEKASRGVPIRSGYGSPGS